MIAVLCAVDLLLSISLSVIKTQIELKIIYSIDPVWLNLNSD